jgi:nitrite reductase (NADH) small subunit
MAWQELIRADLCPPGSSREVVVGEQVVALFNVEGSFYALDGICPHQGGPLGEGELTGCIVTCPWHGWQFDVGTGQQQLNKNMIQPRFETKVEDGTVWGNLPE